MPACWPEVIRHTEGSSVRLTYSRKVFHVLPQFQSKFWAGTQIPRRTAYLSYSPPNTNIKIQSESSPHIDINISPNCAPPPPDNNSIQNFVRMQWNPAHLLSLLHSAPYLLHFQKSYPHLSYLHQKDERVLPGDLCSRKFKFECPPPHQV